MIAEVLQGEIEPVGNPLGVGDRLGEVGKELGHLLRPLQVPFLVEGEEPSRSFEMGVLPDTGEDVEDLAMGLRGIEDAVRRYGGKAVGLSQVAQRPDQGFLAAAELALQLDIDVAVAEGLNNAPRRRLSPFPVVLGQG